MINKLIVTVVLIFSLSGCFSAVENKNSNHRLKYITEIDLIGTNYAAADSLLAQLKGKIDPNKNILVATMVNVDSLYSSSTLGRLTSEQIASRFTQNGYRVVEMKLGNVVWAKSNTGELVLTREIKNLMLDHNAQGVIVGTYGIGQYEVFFNAKFVLPDAGNSVLASQDYKIYKNKDIDRLLNSGKLNEHGFKFR